MAPPLIESGVTLNIPEDNEDGYIVPVSVDAPDALEISIIAEANPTPLVVTFAFGPLSGVQSAATRMRLADAQTVVAVAKMPNGAFHVARKAVTVAQGGCGV